MIAKSPDKETLEALYRRHNRRACADDDPVGFLHAYPRLSDREIAGLVASSLAFGQVGQIRAMISRALSVLGARPSAFLRETKEAVWTRALGDFRHRWVTGRDLAGLLRAAAAVAREYGSLEACFGGGPIVAAQARFVEALRGAGAGRGNRLLASPEDGSACKRLNLFLRWMVRKDEVDPGGWTRLKPSQLIVPLDVHLHRYAIRHGLTRRKQADLKAALEVTGAFRRIAPDDPVRYDFAIAHEGMDRT